MRLWFSDEVEQALSRQLPLVALETSVLAQGLPYPQNLEAARECEEAVRGAGAVPAAIAVLDGEIHVGLANEQLRRLAEGKQPLRKLGSRDLAMAIAQGASGGTTVSATCEIAVAVGVRVFATGGIGGVHRGASQDFDVSQDLGALARFPVAVVCAGAKSVLDLPKTFELLETLGVLVVGVGTSELPAFYSRESGISLEHRADEPKACARLIHARFDTLKQGGIVFAVPPPADTALSRSEVEALISAALTQAVAKGIRGKEVTPFLLSELSTGSSGKTLRANKALLQNNARVAGLIAVAELQLRRT